MVPPFFSEILNKIYCMDGPGAVLALLCATGAFLLARFLWREKRWFRSVLLAGLVLWGCAVVCITVFSREPGATLEFGVLFHSYRQVLAAGNPELLRSNFMNVLLFFPG